MKKVTLILASNEGGGLEKHVIELANGLSQTCRVTLIASVLYQHDVKTEVKFIPFDFNRSRYNLFARYQLKRAILESQPDIVHAHGGKAVKMVSTFVNKTAFKGIRFIAGLHSLKKKTQDFDVYHHVTCSSQFLISCLSAQTQHKTSVVYNGIDMPKVQYQGLKHEKPRLLAIGQLRAVKGFDVLIQAMQGIDAELWIVGEGEERAHLEQLIQQTQQQHKIKLLGYRKDVHELLSQVDLHVISSLSEGGPYTFAESLLIKTPVISTRVGVPQNYLPEQFLTSVNDVSGLHHLIQTTLADPQYYQKFLPIFAQAEQDFTLEAMLNKEISIYHSIEK